jgi:ketose-bisphosphate aldolase
MALVKFTELMEQARRGRFAVGYFESWDMESLQAVADAAEAKRSPVLLGFSGVYLHHPKRQTRERVAAFAAFGNEVCRSLNVPACLVFNESPHFERVLDAVDQGFGMVMYSSEDESLTERVREVVARAHPRGVAVEAEMSALCGVAGELSSVPEEVPLTDPRLAQAFIAETEIDALAVNVGQVHLHGRKVVRLNLEVLTELSKVISVPLVLHGATSVARDDLKVATQLGVCKINVGSVLKKTYFEKLRSMVMNTASEYNPYEVVGSGLAPDVTTAARLAMQRVVEDLMVVFGSAGRA